MKRYLLFMFTALVMAAPAFSQAYESTIEYGKKKQQAIAVDFAYSQEAVENAIVQRIEKLGYQAKMEKGLFNKDKGFIIFKNAFITDISESSMDYLVKVDRKSRKEKDESTLYIIMQKDGANSLTAMDAYGVGKAKGFLNNLLPDVEAANLELQIKAQDEVVVKAEKKFKDLQDDQASMEKKIKDLEDSLKKNATDQENQKKEIENTKQALEALKAKRKVQL
jgi:hypothetical protein